MSTATTDLDEVQEGAHRALLDPGEPDAPEAAAAPLRGAVRQRRDRWWTDRKTRWARRGRRRRMLDRLGWYELSVETIMTSTRQAEAINAALMATHPPIAGPLLGTAVETGQPVTSDPHELYNAKPRRVSSPNVTVIGDVAMGKSALGKTHYGERPLALGKQVAVFDRKKQKDQTRDDHGFGEYDRLRRVFGGAMFRFDRGSGRGCVFNILDPRILIDSSVDGQGEHVVGQDELLLMVATQAHGELGPLERAALRAAHRAAIRTARDQGRVAVLRDVVDALFDPDESAIPRPTLKARGIVDEVEMTRWGLEVAVDLDRYLDGDLSGLIDGPTANADGSDLDLSAALLVFDTSALGEESPALALVMAIVMTYLSSIWSTTPGQREIILEEGYHAVGMPLVSKLFRSLAKRGRGIGLAVVIVVHHLSDLPNDSDLRSLIRESGSFHVFKQSQEDESSAVVKLLGWPDHVRETLASLEPGTHLYQVGSEPPMMITGYRSPLERWICDTDAGMAGPAHDVEESPFTSFEHDPQPGHDDTDAGHR